MAKKGVLSALTTIGYGMVFLVVVIVGAVLVQIGIYGIGEKDEPIVGLEISSTEINTNNTLNVVTNDTTKQLSFTILGNADLEGSAVEQSSVTVRLSIRNSLGTALIASNRPVHFLVIDENGEPVLDAENNLQTTDTVDVGINDTVKLVLATYDATNTLVADAEEATYIKGGTCYIEAYSVDGRFKAQRIEINVDVPVETIKVTVTGYDQSGTLGNLTDIINDTVETFNEVTTMATATSDNLGLVVLYTGETGTYTNNTYYRCVAGSTSGTYTWQATNMQYFIKNDQLELGVQAFPTNSLQAVSSMQKLVQYISQNFSTSEATLNSSTGILVINGESEDTTGALTIQAKVLKSYGGTEYVDAEITICSAKLKIESITIGNQEVIDGGVSILVGDTLQFSANSSTSTASVSGIINLNVSIRSKYYTHGVDPLSENISGLVMHIVDNHTTESTVPEGYVNVSSINSDYRSALVIENTTQYESENNIKWELLAKRQLITEEEIDLYIAEYNSQSTTFNSDNPYAHITISISTVNPAIFSYTGEDTLSIVKYDGGMTGTNVEDVEDLTSGFISYSTSDSESLTYTKWVYFLESSSTNINGTGSSIIEVSTAGQVMRTEGSTVQYSEVLNGLGNGTARIRAYLVRTDESGNPIDCRYNVITQSDTTSYVEKDDADISNTDYVGQYVVEYSASEYFTVTVEELLDLTLFYYDEDLSLLVADTTIPSEMGTTLDNVKYVYLQGNSIYALINEFNNISVDKEVTQIDASLVMVNIEDEVIVDTDAETGYWTKAYLKIQLISAQANTFRIFIEDNGISINGMYFEAKDVAVSLLEADWSELASEYATVQPVDGINTINIYGQLSSGVVSWYYGTGSEGVSFSLPYNINYTYNVVGEEQGNTMLYPLNEGKLQYNVYALSDEQLAQALAGTLVWTDTLICDTISVQVLLSDGSTRIGGPDPDSELTVSGIKLLLKEGWTAETDNLVLAYLVTSSDGETSVQAEDFYELIFNGTLPTATWTDGTIETTITSSNFDVSGISNFDLSDDWTISISYDPSTYAWVANDYSTYMSISLSDDSTVYDINNYLYVDANGIIQVKTGFAYSSSDTSAVNALNNNSTFTVRYVLYDSVSDIAYEKLLTITLNGVIEVDE